MFGLKEESVVGVDVEVPNAPSNSIQQQSYAWFTHLGKALQKGWQAIFRGLPVEPSTWEKSLEPATSMNPLQGPCLSCSAFSDDPLEAQSVRTALRVVGLHLTKQGFILGQDFSMGREKLILNAKAYAYLQQSMAPEQFSDVIELEAGLLIQDQS